MCSQTAHLKHCQGYGLVILEVSKCYEDSYGYTDFFVHWHGILNAIQYNLRDVTLQLLTLLYIGVLSQNFSLMYGNTHIHHAQLFRNS